MALNPRLREFLDQQDVEVEMLPHREAFTAQEVAQTAHVSGRRVAKVVVVRDGKGFVLAVLPAPDRLDLEALRRVAARPELEVASESEFESLFPDCERGAMPPFGNLYGVPVYFDASFREYKKFYFQAGNHAEVAGMRLADFERLVRPIAGDFGLQEYEHATGVPRPR